MDLQDLQPDLPSSNDSNANYTFDSPRPQNFFLPYPFMKYIYTNPSSGKAWKKLIQTCKLFFSKNHIYPVKCLKYDHGGKKCDADGEMFDSMKNIAKLWIYDEIYVHNVTQHFLSSLIPKIEKCNLRSLNIMFQHLTFDDYQFLISSGDLKGLCLTFCTIGHLDGTLVTFDQLLENIPNLKNCYMSCDENSSSMFQKDTVKKFVEILQRLKELYYFSLWGLTEEFDFTTITDFLLKNEKLIIDLTFDKNIPLSDAYKEIIEKFIAKIIETPPKIIPLITFHGFENSVYYDDYQKLLNQS